MREMNSRQRHGHGPCTIRNFHILPVSFQINAFKHRSCAVQHTPNPSSFSPIQRKRNPPLLAARQPTPSLDNNLRTGQLQKNNQYPAAERSYWSPTSPFFHSSNAVCIKSSRAGLFTYRKFLYPTSL
jgi:hypothetical protein